MTNRGPLAAIRADRADIVAAVTSWFDGPPRIVVASVA